MTVTTIEGTVTEGARTLEVRWILPGQLKTEVADWFGRFRARVETREDTYLVDPHLPGLSVKIRGTAALEVKVYQGSPGLLEVADRARGRVESWREMVLSLEAAGPGPGQRRPGRLATGAQAAADKQHHAGRRVGQDAQSRDGAGAVRGRAH